MRPHDVQTRGQEQEDFIKRNGLTMYVKHGQRDKGDKH